MMRNELPSEANPVQFSLIIPAHNEVKRLPSALQHIRRFFDGTGFSLEVIAVVEVDGRTIGDGKPGPITRDLKERFHAFAREA